MHAEPSVIAALAANESIDAAAAHDDLAVFLDLSQALHRCTSRDALCSTLAACVRWLLGGEASAVFVAEDGTHARLCGAHGTSGNGARAPQTAAVALDRWVVEELVGHGALVLPQVETPTPAMRDVLDLGVLPVQVQSFFAFALQRTGQLSGMVVCASAQPCERVPRSVRLVEPLLNEAARALEHLAASDTLRQHAEALERTRALVDATNDAILLLDDQGRVSLINRRAKFFFGLREEDVLGEEYAHLQTLFATLFEAPQQFTNWLTPLLQAGRERAVREFQTIHPTPRLLQCFTAPVRTYPSATDDMTSRLLGRLLVFRDITREREIDQMKNDFVSTVSHELRTPLTSIRGALQLVLGQRNTPAATHDHESPTLPQPATGLSRRAHALLGVSLSNTERLIRLINDILDIAKIEHGSIQLQREAIDPKALCRIAQSEVAGFASVRGIRVVLDIHDALAPVYADRDRTVQVLTNLLSNAIKFSSEGQRVVLSVSADAPTSSVRFAVRDWGRGIALQDQQRIFQRFQQLDSSTTRDVGGTGLGLAICKALVHEHGGALWVESVLTEGSTFFFTLPVYMDTTSDMQATHQPEHVTAPHVPQPSAPAVVDESASRQHHTRFVHLFSSPLTTLEGAIAMLRHRSSLGGDALSQTLLDAAGRSIERIKQAAELLQTHASFDDEAVSIRLLGDVLRGPHSADPSTAAPPDGAQREGVPIEPPLVEGTHGQPPASASATAHGLVLVVTSDARATPLRALLEHEGHALLCTASVGESIDTARERRPDVIVLDLDFPVAQDASVVQVLREDPETKTIPVLYVSSDPAQFAQLPPHATTVLREADPDLLYQRVSQAIVAGRTTSSHLKTILIVDDEADIRQLLVHALASEGYRTVEVDSGTAALMQAQQQPFDLILLDLMLPDLDGFAVLGGLRARAQTALTPIILLSALHAPHEKVQGLQLGADDYITKPFDPAELCARVRAAMRRSELEGSSNPSTRLSGNIAIERVISRRIEQGQLFAVCYCDLDNFKAYNDAYGFLKGDAVIHQTAHVLIAAVEQSGNADDFVGHIGGDDFVIVTTPERLEAVCRTTLHHFDALAPLFYDASARGRGYIESVDRKGQPARFPLVSLSIAVVTNSHTPIRHLAEVAERAIDLKKQAKQREGSVYLSDDAT